MIVHSKEKRKIDWTVVMINFGLWGMAVLLTVAVLWK